MKAAILFLLSILVCGQAVAQSYSVFTFDAPTGMTISAVRAINNEGQILAAYLDSSQQVHWLLRNSNGSSHDEIRVPGATQTNASALNNLGQVAGWYTDATGRHSFIRSSSGAYTTFDMPTGENILSPAPVASAMNDKGDLAGTAFSFGSAQWGYLVSGDRTLFTTVEAGTWTQVTSVNNSGEVGGTCRFGSSYGLKHGFVRKADGTYRLIDAPGAVLETTVTAMNNRGQVIANDMVLNPDGTSAAFDPALGKPTALDDNGRLAGTVTSGGITRGFLAVPATGTQPVIRPVRGVISASGFGAFETIAPGSWIEVYGSNLSKTTRQWQSSDFTGDVAPTSLDDVIVTINGRRAFVSYVSPGQVNAQVTDALTPGSVQVTVTTSAGTSLPYRTKVAAVKPGLLAISQDVAYTYPLAVFPDYRTFAVPQIAYPTVPPMPRLQSRLAKPGDTVVMYGIGFGGTYPAQPAGQVARHLAELQGRLEIWFGLYSAQLSYIGVAPGSVGLYQFNVVVPEGVRGEVKLSVMLDGEPLEQQTKLSFATEP